MKYNFIDLAGQKFGMLTALKVIEKRHKQTIWNCKCDCGNESKQYSFKLRNGTVKSCGCQRIKHNGVNTRLYGIWVQMKARCSNPNHAHFKNYGGRGLLVCDRWVDFKNFQDDLKVSHDNHAKNHGINNTTLERVDNSKGYSPDNCVWATKKEQPINCRKDNYNTYKGKVITTGEVADKYGIKYETIESRLRRGWTIEKIIETPVKEQVGGRKKKIVYL